VGHVSLLRAPLLVVDPNAVLHWLCTVLRCPLVTPYFCLEGTHRVQDLLCGNVVPFGDTIPADPAVPCLVLLMFLVKTLNVIASGTYL